MSTRSRPQSAINPSTPTVVAISRGARHATIRHGTSHARKTRRGRSRKLWHTIVASGFAGRRGRLAVCSRYRRFADGKGSRFQLPGDGVRPPRCAQLGTRSRTPPTEVGRPTPNRLLKTRYPASRSVGPRPIQHPEGGADQAYFPSPRVNDIPGRCRGSAGVGPRPCRPLPLAPARSTVAQHPRGRCHRRRSTRLRQTHSSRRRPGAVPHGPCPGGKRGRSGRQGPGRSHRARLSHYRKRRSPHPAARSPELRDHGRDRRRLVITRNGDGDPNRGRLCLVFCVRVQGSGLCEKGLSLRR